MSLDPQAKTFLEQIEAAGLPKIEELSPAAAREQTKIAVELIGPGPDVATVEDFAMPTSTGELPARRYVPPSASGTVLWLHGGGWVICDLETHDAMCRLLAIGSGCRVIAVDYRRAPEHPFPGPLEDCWAALCWVAGRHDGEPLALGGDSAGGNLAAVCAQRARDRGGPALSLQVLVYPVTDHDMTRRSYLVHGTGPDTFLTTSEMAWYWSHYVSDQARRADPEASPLGAETLAGLPPAIVLTAEYDPLCDEGLAYVERLRMDGVPVSHHHYDDMIHAFFSFVNVIERGNEAVADVGAEIRASLAAPAG